MAAVENKNNKKTGQRSENLHGLSDLNSLVTVAARLGRNEDDDYMNVIQRLKEAVVQGILPRFSTDGACSIGGWTYREGLTATRCITAIYPEILGPTVHRSSAFPFAFLQEVPSAEGLQPQQQWALPQHFRGWYASSMRHSFRSAGFGQRYMTLPDWSLETMQSYELMRARAPAHKCGLLGC
jgi:hypothetical protein